MTVVHVKTKTQSIRQNVKRRLDSYPARQKKMTNVNNNEKTSQADGNVNCDVVVVAVVVVNCDVKTRVEAPD